jgi:hypothetical protein
VPVDQPGKMKRRRRIPGARKRPNLESLFDAGSTRRVMGKVEQAEWSDRQYADLDKYFMRKHLSRERSAAGCYQWQGSTKVGTGTGQATFCGVQYNAQLLYYFSVTRDERMQPNDKVVASCGNILCITKEHLTLKRNLDACLATPPIPASQRQPRTAFYSLTQWKAMTPEEVEVLCNAKPLQITAPTQHA